MSLQATLDKISGANERIESALSALAASNASLATANARIVELEASLAAAPSSDLSAEVARLTGELAAANTNLASEKERADKAEANLKAEQEAIPGKINKGIADGIAAAGFTDSVSTIQGKKEDGKPDLSNLTGIAKTTAAFKAKSQAAKVS